MILGKGTDGSNGDKNKHSGVILRWVEVCNGVTGHMDSDFFTLSDIGPEQNVDVSLIFNAPSDSWCLEMRATDEVYGLLLRESRMGCEDPQASHGGALDWATGRVVSYFLFGSAWHVNKEG